MTSRAKSPRDEAREQGLTHYYTGRFCRRGHLTARYTRTGSCVECDRVRKQSPEAVAKQRACMKAWRARNKEARAAYQKSWRAAHKEDAAAYHKRWQSENAERINEQRREAILANMILAVAGGLRGGVIHRARSKGLACDAELLSRELYVEWLRAQPNCPICGVELDVGRYRPRNRNAPTIDQLVPGAGYTLRNTRLICLGCNRRKSDATPADLRRLADWIEEEMAS